MANCDLSIRLDPTRDDHTYETGETIRGAVIVRVDQNVNCTGLQIRTKWATHGRGNVDSGVTDTTLIEAGQWTAGQTKEYPFELNVDGWPPTYHGHYLNIDHAVEARAKIPWGFDPKASLPFRVRPTSVPDSAKGSPSKIAIQGRMAAILVVLATFVFFSIGIVMTGKIGWFMLPFLIIVPIVLATFFVFRFVLPKWVLGNVDASLDAENVSPGQQVSGELTIQPKKNVSINAITLTLMAEERCVSGSGSNRTTHRHQILQQLYTVSEPTTLRPNQLHRFPLKFQLPTNAPYSIDLGANDLTWTANLVVDLPRWPDWRKTMTLRVVPSGESSPRDDSVPLLPTTPVTSPSTTSANEDITFAETARHLWSMREDRDQTQMLVEAVTGLTLDMQAIVERRLLYAGAEDPHLFKNGHAIWAHYPDPELPMVLYVPHELADEFEQIGREAWQGRGTIVGWDKRHGRLQVKLEPA